ncbi:MAG: lysylphosphatidylglycerol synthase transmembrane domain-containing protein [Candidatus Rokuibacteriota bacterium]
MAAGAAISVALFAYLLWSVDLRELAAQLRQTRWGWLALAVALAPAGLFARAARWRYLFPPHAEAPGLVPAVMIGYMGNNVLPLRAGELVRVYVVARRWRQGFWTVVATLVVERVLDSLALVLLLAALIFVIPVPVALEWAAAVLLAVDVVAVAALAAVALRPDGARRLIDRLMERWPALRQRIGTTLETFVRGLDGIRTRAHILPLTAWTLVVWAIPALAAWASLRAVNLELPWVAGWAVLVFVGIGISIPSAPGYVGVFHYAATLATGIFGVSPAAAVGYALVYHASQFVPITLLGWLYLMKEGMTLGEATHALPDERLPKKSETTGARR